MNRNIIKLLTIFFLFACMERASGQKILEEKLTTISSVIKDDSGNVLPGAKVAGKEGSIEVWSDIDGKFTITVPQETDLMIEKEGYFKQIIPVAEIPEVISITAAPFLMGDENDVNIAFEKVKQKEVTGVIDIINPEKMLPIDGTHFWYDILEGRSFGRMSNNPLFIIDGIPRVPGINLMNGLVAEEIEQITILRDANACVLYGTQARNGVIMIKTKRGETYKHRHNITLERGTDQPVILPKYVGSAKYMELYNEAVVNDGGDPLFYSEQEITNYQSGNRYRYPDVDYYSDEFLRATRPATRLNTEFSGGNKNTQYYANLGWFNTGSLYKLGKGKDASTNEMNIRANADVKITDFIKSNLDAAVNFVFDKGPNGNFWDMASTYHPYYYSPLIPVSMLTSEAADLLGDATKYIDNQYILGGTNQYQNNVYGNMYLGGYNQNIQRLISITNGVDVDLKGITEGLSFKTLIGLDMYNQFSQTVANTYAVYQPTWSDSPVSIPDFTKINEDEASGVQNLGNNYFYRQLTTQAVLDYNRTYSEVHTFGVTALGYFTKLRRDFYIIDDKASHIGLRLAYDYAKRYFVDFSSAYVHSIKLHEDNRNAFSPTIGFGWVISEENFLANSIAIDYLKLKVSAGILNTDVTEDLYNRYFGSGEEGNDLEYRLYQSNILGNGSFGWNDGTSNTVRVIRGFDNPDLTFEKVKDLNIGLEGYFFNKSIMLDANVFFVQNSGIVVQRFNYYPANLAYYIPYENYEVNNYNGVELGINWLKSIGDFSVNLGGRLMYRKSKIDTRDEIYNNDFQYFAGNSVYSIFGLRSDGFFRDDADISASPDQTALGGVPKPGDIKYKDLDNDGYITEDDQEYLGTSFSPLVYGINVLLKYKGVNLFILCNGQNGGSRTTTNDYYWVDGNDKYSEEVLGRWTESTADAATYPRLTAKTGSNNYRGSDFWLYDNSYFQINRIQLTYEFPRGTFGIQGLSLYLRGSNLFMIGENADKIQLDGRIGREPSYRNYAAGVRVSF